MMLFRRNELRAALGLGAVVLAALVLHVIQSREYVWKIPTFFMSRFTFDQYDPS